MARTTVQLPYRYYPDFTKGRALAGAKIYVGIPDLDPTILGNQKSVSVVQEDGAVVPVGQPVLTGSGGVPSYLGSPVQIIVDGEYSMSVLNSMDSQIYYAANVPSEFTALSSYVFNSVADLVAGETQEGSIVDFVSLSAFNAEVSTVGYYGPWNDATGPIGGGTYIILTAAEFVGPPDGFIDHYVGGGANYVAKLKVDGEINARQAGFVADGSDEYTAAQALEAHIYTNRVDCFFPAGNYDVGENRWPFKEDATDAGVPLRDYGGVTIRGVRAESILSSTTSAGKDVLNLNKVKNIRFESLTVTSYMEDGVVQTRGNSNISNGVSLTGGSVNVYVDVNVINCLGVPKTTPGIFLDGGKGLTLQPGNNADQGVHNITLKGTVSNCGYGTGLDVNYELFNTSGSGQPHDVTEIDVIATNCWRGGVFSASAATTAIPDNQKDWAGRVNVTAINCAQGFILSRWVRGRFNLHISNNKANVDFYRPIPSDQTVYACFIDGNYESEVTVNGRMNECDYKYQIGGTTQGGGVFAGTNKLIAQLSVDAGQVDTADINAVNVGGNVAKNSIITITNISDTSYTGLMESAGILKPEWGNTITVGASPIPQVLESQQFSVPREGQSYNSFSVDSKTGFIEMVRGGSGSAGSENGFVFIKDSISGATYKIQIYT